MFYKKHALILGGAACVWDDAAEALTMFTPDIVIAVNDIGTVWPTTIHHWVSYHHDQLLRWVEKRKDASLEPAHQLWTGPAYPRGTVPSFMKSLPCYGGSSGFLAVTLSLEVEKCTKVILAGVPMDPMMPHFNMKMNGNPWVDGRNYQKHWEIQKHKLVDVRSMSGFTASLLGRPTKEWIYDGLQ